MELRRLSADVAAVRFYVEELWLPYRRELDAMIDGQALADDVDVVAEEVAFRLEHLQREHHRTWIAVDTGGDDRQSGDDQPSGALAGFVTTDLDVSPPVFDRPDRLHVGDVYVREPYRGTGLARRLFARAAERARRLECAKLSLDVDVDNERALAFYEKLGFETRRHRMAVGTDDLGGPDDLSGLDYLTGPDDLAGSEDEPVGTNDPAEADDPAGTDDPPGADNSAGAGDPSGVDDPSGADVPSGADDPPEADDPLS